MHPRISGVYDIADDLAIGKRELIVKPTERGRAAGLRLQDVATQLRRGLFGGRVEVLQRGRDELSMGALPRDARRAYRNSLNFGLPPPRVKISLFETQPPGIQVEVLRPLNDTNDDGE